MNGGQIHLGAKNVYEIDGGVYFFNIDFNSLFRFDIQTRSIRHLDAFLEYQTQQKILFGDFVVENDKELFFFPGYGNFIGIYNTQSNKDEKVLFNSDYVDQKNINFSVAKIIVSVKKVWIFLSDTSLGVYVLDLESHQIQKDDDLSEKIKDYPTLVWKLEQSYDNFSFVQTSDLKFLLQIDVEKGNFIEREMPVLNGIIIGDNGKQIWLYVANSTEIYEWSVEENEVSVYLITDEELVNKGQEYQMPPYARCVCYGDDVFVLGWGIDAIMKLNRAEKKIERAFALPEKFLFYEYKKTSKFISSFWSVEMIGEKICFFPCSGNMILIYDPKSGEVRGEELLIDKKKIINYREMIIDKLYNEYPQSETNDYFSLYDCLDYGQKQYIPRAKLEENIGQQIWSKLKSE
ncbi:MAG: hypothetical protein K2O59_06665 [Lachnospiraceae bacterium]|nr:hypothetical protein [Lachnospiraceae bacterium]